MFSLLIIPILSALRGYFQGLNYSFPFGVSQLLEQLVRVVCILVGTYLIRVQFNGSILSAVILSTFASSIGNSCISLSTFYRKKRNLFQLKDFYFLPLKSISHMKGLAIDIIKESLPFVYVGSAISILQLIDQFSLKGFVFFVFLKVV